MITSLDIFLKVKQRLNKVDTQDDENLPAYVVVEAFNKSRLNVINRLIGKNNTYKTGIESTTTRVDDLQMLINDEPYPLTVIKKEGYYLTTSLPEDYFRYIRTNCTAHTIKCKKKNMSVFLHEESNLNTLLGNDHLNPSFEWAETIGTIANNKIKVFTQDKFIVDKVFLTYLKEPTAIDIIGYIRRDGNPSTNIDPNLSDDLVEMMIDETCRILSGDMQNQFNMQVSQQNLQMSE